jgi:hypothetical protein
MPDELTIAEIQQAVFEYRANFKEPATNSLYGERQGEIIKALQKALSPWHVGFENISWNQAAKNVAEVQCTFAVPSLLAALQLGVVGVTMSAFNPDWSRARQGVSLFQTAADALKASTGQDFQSQLITLGFHVKPGAKPFKAVLGQFVNSVALGANDASMYGVSVYAGDYSFVIDGSAIVQGGVFIKLIRNFAAEKRFEEMAKILYSDEETILRRLGMKLQ